MSAVFGGRVFLVRILGGPEQPTAAFSTRERAEAYAERVAAFSPYYRTRVWIREVPVDEEPLVLHVTAGAIGHG